MKKANKIAELLGALSVSVLVKPLLLICGINWLLEALGNTQIPYSLASWFGGVLLIMAFNVTITTNLKEY